MTGTLTVGNGGTGGTTYTAGGLLRGNGTAALTVASAADIVAAISTTAVANASAVPWTGVSSKPTTVSGYGITDAITTGNISTQSVASATTAGNVSGTVAIANGGTGSTSASAALTALGAYPASNPNVYTSNTGTVTSVSLSLPAQFTVSGSPVSTSGTLTAAWASQTANLVFASPNGASGVPTFRTLVASDIPALSYAPTAGSTSVTTLGTVTTGTWTASSIATTYTAAKVTDVQAGTGVSLSATTGSVTVNIGQAVGTGNNVQFNSLGVGTPASTVAGEIRAANNITAYYSDARLKEYISGLSDALAAVESLEGFRYRANLVAASFGFDRSKVEIGLRTQDAEKFAPELVTPAPFDIGQNPDGTEYSRSGQNYMTLDYERLVPYLVEAIKELSAKVKALEAK
ncbi:MAG: hypothetical protein CGW95_14990 [Phenylobacterium zucineum]|nr:MAG: hypothetical protein CGW95_14990 [Phenylobacterium zucineum]